MALPPSILKQLWEAGYGGKVIRVPAKNQRLELKVVANEILKEAERLYESKGTTFVLERRGRSDFYRSFGALKLCRRFHLSIEEARKVRRRAYSRWSHWVRESEANVLRAADKFGESGEGRRKYLEVRERVRGGEEVNGVDRRSSGDGLGIDQECQMEIRKVIRFLNCRFVFGSGYCRIDSHASFFNWGSCLRWRITGICRIVCVGNSCHVWVTVRHWRPMRFQKRSTSLGTLSGVRAFLELWPLSSMR